MDQTITIEVAYAKPEQQWLLTISGTEGITAEQAVQQSGILEICPEIDLSTADLGIFGKVAKKNAVLSAGDRVEIYRSLIADPKQARKKRAKKSE